MMVWMMEIFFSDRTVQKRVRATASRDGANERADVQRSILFDGVGVDGISGRNPKRGPAGARPRWKGRTTKLIIMFGPDTGPRY
jgi:hypothetical protein